MACSYQDEVCDGSLFAKGLCRKHYMRVWSRERAARGDSLCVFDGCVNVRHAHGLCGGHLWQRSRGRPLTPLDPQVRGSCSVPDCDRSHFAKGLCRKHHYRWREHGDPLATVVAPKGSGSVTKDGYRVLVIDGKQIGEHRWVMQQHLGRELFPDETVHHKNGVRHDNKLSNLELWSSSHPSGQRVEDKVAWAVEMLRRYQPEVLSAA